MLYGFKSPTGSDEDEHLLDDGEPSSSDQALPAIESGDAGRRWLFAALGLFAGLALAAGIWAVWPSDNDGITQEDIDAAIADALNARPGDDTAANVFTQIAPSLVVVRAMGSDPDAAANVGSGVVINEQGQILTANHVVRASTAIELVFADGTVAIGEISAEQPELDIAVVRARNGAGTLVPAVMGNSRTLRVGDPIFAVGNPLGLTASLSGGVVSGLNRSLPFPRTEGDEARADSEVFEDLIQFDAAVNQGSSGGPLLNADGQVVGIVTALADPTGEGFFIGIGFAVPIDVAAGGAADGPAQ